MSENIDVTVDSLADIQITIVDEIPIKITVDPLDEAQIVISDLASEISVKVSQDIVNIDLLPDQSPQTIEVSTPVPGPQGIQGPQGPPGLSLTFFEKKLDSINALATKVIDSVPLIDFKMIEYTFRASNSPNDKTKGLKMLVRKTDSSVNDQVFARMGDAISFNIGAQINGLNMNLILQNNENFALDLALIRASL